MSKVRFQETRAVWVGYCNEDTGCHVGVFAGYAFDSLLSLKALSAIGTLISFSTFVSEIVFLFYVLVATISLWGQ